DRIDPYLLGFLAIALFFLVLGHFHLLPQVVTHTQNFPTPSCIQPLPTIPLPRRSLQYASLPVASFEAPLSCLRPHPNIKAYVDRRALRSLHRDTIAGPRIDLDDLLLLRFVLRTEDKSREIGAALEIVDDYPFDLCSQRSQDVR